MTFLFAPTVQFLVYSDDATLRQLNRMRILRDGWHYGSGKKIRPDLIELAKGAVRRLKALGATATEAFPALDGGVLLAAYRGAVCVDLIIHSIDDVSLVVEENEHDVYERERLTLNGAIGLVGENRWLSDPSYASHTHSCTAIYTIDSNLPPLVNHLTTTAFPSFSGVVSITGGRNYANTSRNITSAQLAESPLFSFNSKTTNYQRVLS